jgi:hypothetical protein
MRLLGCMILSVLRKIVVAARLCDQFDDARALDRD